MNEEQLRLAVEHFSVLPDPQIDRTKAHPLVNVVVIALCAVISEAESFYGIQAFGELKRDWRSSFLDVKSGHPLTRTPSAGCLHGSTPFTSKAVCWIGSGR